MAKQTPGAAGEDLVRAEQVLSAAEHNDRLAFAALAERLGSLEEAQAIVRDKGIVRMADRIVTALPTLALRTEEDDEDRDGSATGEPTLHGHFAVFNEWTEINSMFEGNFLERIAPGAFKKTFRENRQNMRVLFQHGHDPQIGDKPLGAIDQLSEDSVGARYEVPLLDAPYVRNDILPGLRAGLYGASFRFRVMREEFVSDPGASEQNPNGLDERTIKEAQVMEFGPVTFPAYASATAGVRSASDDLEGVTINVSGTSVVDAATLTEAVRQGLFRVKSESSANGDGAVEVVSVAPSKPDAAQQRTSGDERREPRFQNREEWLRWLQAKT